MKPREETLHKPKHFIVAAALLVGVAVPVGAQQPSSPPTIPYGSPIGLEAAKKVMAAAEAEAVKNNWPMAIVILDSTGHIVMLHRLDNTQYGSISVAEDKAHTALDFRRPSKVFEDLVAQGGIGMRTLGLRGATPSRVASQLLPTARSSEPSVSRAGPLRRMDRLPRLAPILRRSSRRPAPRRQRGR